MCPGTPGRDCVLGNWTMSWMPRDGSLKPPRSPFLFYVQNVDPGVRVGTKNIFSHLKVKKPRSQEASDIVKVPELWSSGGSGTERPAPFESS